MKKIDKKDYENGFKKLPFEFFGMWGLNWFRFTRLKRSGNVLMHQLSKGESLYRYDVFIAKKSYFSLFSGGSVEVYPSKSNIGIDAWSFLSYKDAIDKFNELNDE